MTSQLLDIFSKAIGKKSKVKKKKSIIVDYREKNSLVVSELIELGLETEIKELKVGDYLVNEVAIERKTVSDFISSMMNKRLLRQLEEIQQYKKKMLIIEGIDEQELYTDSEERIGMHPNAIRGFLLSIILKYNVPIVYTKDYQDTAKFISVLSKKSDKEPSLNVTKKNLNKKERMQFIIESFQGVGPKTAQKLLEKFGGIKEIIDAPFEELEKEIGKKAEAFRILDETY